METQKIYTTAKTTDVTEIMDFVKPYFNHKVIPTIHNLVWQVVVNRFEEEKKLTFDNVYNNEGNHVLARVYDGESGFYDTKVQFLDNVTFEKGRELVKYLNGKIFGQKVDQSEMIKRGALHPL